MQSRKGAVTTPQKGIQMKKTKLMATITQTLQGNESHVDRRVYVDDNERLYVSIDGEFVSLTFLFTHGRKVSCWRS